MSRRKRTPADKPSKPYQLALELDEDAWGHLEFVRTAMGMAHRKEAIQWALLIAANSAVVQKAATMRASSRAVRALLIACVNVSEQPSPSDGIKSQTP